MAAAESAKERRFAYCSCKAYCGYETVYYLGKGYIKDGYYTLDTVDEKESFFVQYMVPHKYLMFQAFQH